MKKSSPTIPKNITEARGLAVHILMRVAQGEHMQAALDTAIHKHALHEKDIHLCTELVYGFTRYQYRIEYILDTLLPRRTALPIEMQYIIGSAAYALLFLARVPHHATVHWAVGHVRKRFGQGLSRVCNGVLRALLRLENAPHEQDFYNKNLAAFYAVPSWLYTLWINAYGAEVAKNLFIRSLARPKACIRLTTRHKDFTALQKALRTLGEDTALPVGVSGWVFMQKTPTHLLDTSLKVWHERGAFSWQAAGSQEALAQCFTAVPALTHAPWWDACAGQGGKSFALTEHGVEVLLASDTSYSRLMQGKKTAQRLYGVSTKPCTTITEKKAKILPTFVCMTAQQPALSAWSGNILLDVPCSGLGTLARRPEIRQRRTQHIIQELTQTQRDLLCAVWEYVPVGKHCVYMTCTLNPAENENIVQYFMEKHQDAEQLFQWQSPHDHPWLEGMYVAVLHKQDIQSK